jgi:hypothetical protein
MCMNCDPPLASIIMHPHSRCYGQRQSPKPPTVTHAGHALRELFPLCTISVMKRCSFTSFPLRLLYHSRTSNVQAVIDVRQPRLPSTLECGRYRSRSSSFERHLARINCLTCTAATAPPLFLSTRSTHVFDLPADWIDKTKAHDVHEQWGRKVGTRDSESGVWPARSRMVDGSSHQQLRRRRRWT